VYIEYQATYNIFVVQGHTYLRAHDQQIWMNSYLSRRYLDTIDYDHIFKDIKKSFEDVGHVKL
jgi:hypothetical protein